MMSAPVPEIVVRDPSEFKESAPPAIISMADPPEASKPGVPVDIDDGELNDAQQPSKPGVPVDIEEGELKS
jgi:hypothetical protein